MKNNKYIFYILGLIVLFFFIKDINNTRTVSKSEEDQLEIVLNTIVDEYDRPQVSGLVSNLPWRNNSDFLMTKEEYETPILMAGFCAVLKNPLPGEAYNVALASDSMKGIVLKPSEIFSMNGLIGPYNKSKGYKEGASYSDGNIVMTEGGGVCKIATISYNLAVLSDLEIIERYHHSMPINYVPYGQDATVFYGVKDIKFKNTTGNNILIWSQMIDHRLYMAFYGLEKPPHISWNHEISNIIEPPTKYIQNPNLDKGKINIVTQGLEGADVQSSITKIYQDGRIKTENMGISKYRPLAKLVEVN